MQTVVRECVPDARLLAILCPRAFNLNEQDEFQQRRGALLYVCIYELLYLH
jgi:hypothetical protein